MKNQTAVIKYIIKMVARKNGLAHTDVGCHCIYCRANSYSDSVVHKKDCIVREAWKLQRIL